MLRGLRRRVGRRGAALLFFAFLDIVYCHGLIFPPRGLADQPSFKFLASVMPLWAWGALWGLAGVACLVFAFRRYDMIGFAAAMAIKVLWGLVFLLGAFMAGLERGLVSATIWLALAALVALLGSWPEPDGGKGPSWTRQSR